MAELRRNALAQTLAHSEAVGARNFSQEDAERLTTQILASAESYTAAGKRIIYFCGDDHSFEHLYKDGVHYVRPGCGRDANYAQQKQLADAKYSLFYNQVSCFSTVDMSASGDTVLLQAYDLQGNIFYSYDFSQTTDVVNVGEVTTASTTKCWVDDQLLIYHDERIYNILGTTIKQ
jgi:hypothetical protein